MSNQLNPNQSIGAIKEKVGKAKYNDVLQLRLLESQFDNKMVEYQRTYKNFLAYSKQHVEMEWKDRYPVTVSNTSASIDFNHPGNITKDECFANCANDDKCKYVLWSDSGKDTGFQCAPNKCQKYTTSAGGLVSNSDGTTISNPTCSALFATEEAAAILANPILGAAAVPALLAEFPPETKYKYHGWEKPTWQVNSDKSVTQGIESDNPDWKVLQHAKTAAECNKQASNLSSQTPFDMVVHTPIDGSDEGFCHAHMVKDGASTDSTPQMVDRTGSTVSIPPGGQTGQIVAAKISVVRNLNRLNGELRDILRQMWNISEKMEPIKQKNEEASKYQLKKLFNKVKRLKADREKIRELSGELVTADAQNETLRLKHDANQLLYLGMNVVFVGLAAITLKHILSK